MTTIFLVGGQNCSQTPIQKDLLKLGRFCLTLDRLKKKANGRVRVQRMEQEREGYSKNFNWFLHQ
eukprot:403357358